MKKKPLVRYTPCGWRKLLPSEVVRAICGPELPFVRVSPEMMRHRRYLLALASFDMDEIEECQLEGREPRHPVEAG